MWWRRCKTAHSLVTTIATNRFVTLAISCKLLEVLVDIYIPLSLILWKKYIIILTFMKYSHSVLYYSERESFKKIKFYCLM